MRVYNTKISIYELFTEASTSQEYLSVGVSIISQIYFNLTSFIISLIFRKLDTLSYIYPIKTKSTIGMHESEERLRAKLSRDVTLYIVCKYVCEYICI